MKRISFVVICNLFMLCFGLSCERINHHNINIHVSDSEQYYKMSARFNENQTRNVDKYMNDRIGKTSSMSFVNTRIDGQLALDDHTTFYIKKYPGYLEIKLDKGKNTEAAYYKIKAMCNGIKDVLAGKRDDGMH